ncbi:MAG: hypothetical protein DRN08_00265 [Thermoplasmata archaeon]|nr:MAG: hypothetical protein DRN05_00540 [Thermoplasmata archaeon]RLF37044.1 MAG: hypothetical protein DRN08_00265 [Thermoplasmata archaeon]
MRKEKLIPVSAILVLLIGIVSTIYVYAMQTQQETNYINVNGRDYTVDQLFSMIEPRIFESLNYSGIALDDLIVKTGVSCPECHDYIIIGGDGYQKTVKWENMKNGLLTPDRRVVFSDLPKAFRVRDVVKIEKI